MRLQGALHEAVFTQSLNAIVQRHETLRTTFPAVHGQPVQRIAPVLHLDLPLIDLQAVSAPERESQALRLAAVEARRPFDLAHGPLLRAMLLRLGQQEHFLLLTMHHIVSDFWSMQVFMRELVALSTAFGVGEPSSLPALPIQYADFVAWQRQWLQGASLETHLSYWRQQLAGAPPVLPLSADRPRPAVQTFDGALQPFVLPPSLAEALVTLSRQAGVTLFVTLLAAFTTLLSHYAGHVKDLVVGVPITGRTRVEVEGLIGYFLNTLALRTDLSGDPSFRDILQRVRRSVLAAYAHQELPFDKLVEALQPERSPHHTPVFQVVFNFQNVPPPSLNLPGVTLNPVELDTGTVKHDLTLYMRPQADGLGGAFAYNCALFEAATINCYAGRFCGPVGAHCRAS
jgi:aspartate racemase